MKKRTTINTFLITLCATMLCEACIVIAELITTGAVTHPLVYILVTLIIPVVVTLFVVHTVKINIIDPINNIDTESPEQSHIDEEFSPLIKKISSQNTRILQQLDQIKSESQSKDKLRREFTANVSHELKTPLTSISGYAEIIRDGIAKPEDTTRFAGKIHDESQRLITLVEDIIKLSRLEESDVEVKSESIDLYSLCESVISRLEVHARKRNITLSVSGDRCVITGVLHIIEEMIYNLCDNAVKYNRDNGEVKITIRQFIDGVELTVKDTGIGIETDEIPRIFERFYRVDKSHSKEIGGTGLGLSIVKHGALYHNASITVESKLGKGTAIKILF
ncbi:MAG: ATP-binding protein [Ruminococcus sp.]|nr:ATP-binding protein [Ruminococcus sp.]